MGDFMAIQTINLTVPGGDTPRSANTKINANFSNQTHAASRLVGTGNKNLPEYIDNSGLSAMGYGGSGVLYTLERTFRQQVQEMSLKGCHFFRFDTSFSDSTAALKFAPSLCVQTGSRLTLWSATNKDVRVVTCDTLGGGFTHEVMNLYSDRNTTKDGNGFLKAASPIVKVFADKAELNTDAESQNVTYKKNGVGDYTITTASGLSTDGWYIELPKDMNGNPKVAVTLSEVDGVIRLKSYKRMFSMETFTFEPDLDNPLDIPDGRWIDLRLNEIPVEEANP